MSDEERAQAIAASGGGAAVAGTDGAVDTGTTGGATTSGGTGSGATGAGGSTAGGSTGGGAAGGGGGGGQIAAPKSTGPLRATDTGVTAQEIVVANIADVTGVQPGLFQSARDGATAAAAYINSTGGINGRRVRILALDGKTDSGANRTAMLEACAKAFVVAGSMSAFDDGSAKPGQDCGIPDITAITTNGPKFRATNTYPAFPNGPASIGISPPKYIAEKYPDAIKKAGILWLNQTVTRANALRRKEGWEKAGFNFIYEQEVQVLEADYSRFVLDMEEQGVQYVTMVSDYQNIVRLQKAMLQQGYFPKVRDWDSVAYDPGYIEVGDDAVKGSFIFINTAMFEEAASNPEMRLYLDWLKRAVPGGKATFFGIYAWSAMRLFQKIATEMGADLKRAAFLERLKATAKWDGFGLHGPHNVGGKIPSPCNLYVRVETAFQRMHPAKGFDCSGRVHKLSQSYE